VGVLEALGIGVALGLAAGLTPGPMLALVLSASLQGGFAAGARVAAAPLLSDLPVVPLCVLVLDGLPAHVVAALAIAGGAFVAVLGVRSLRAPAPAGATARPVGARDVGRAVLVNLANPHPWIFWISVGGPVLLRAAGVSTAAAVAFVAGFYGLLVGTKLVLAGATAAGRRRLLAGRGLRIAMRVAALLLVGAGILLIAEGIAELSG
jgi:threonine/homoserine/homoserine lactone efflux protein